MNYNTRSHEPSRLAFPAVPRADLAAIFPGLPHLFLTYIVPVTCVFLTTFQTIGVRLRLISMKVTKLKEFQMKNVSETLLYKNE